MYKTSTAGSSNLLQKPLRGIKPLALIVTVWPPVGGEGPRKSHHLMISHQIPWYLMGFDQMPCLHTATGQSSTAAGGTRCLAMTLLGRVFDRIGNRRGRRPTRGTRCR
jgi:hypothetical protein